MDNNLLEERPLIILCNSYIDRSRTQFTSINIMYQEKNAKATVILVYKKLQIWNMYHKKIYQVNVFKIR